MFLKSSKCKYVYIDKADKGRPVLVTGRTPYGKQNRNCLSYSQNLVLSPGGSQRQDG